MPLLHWQPGSCTFEVVPGERLLDALDDHPELGVSLGCRSANCGTCRVRVVSGEDALLPADPWEASVLSLHAADRDERLGCQLRFRADATLEPVTLQRLP